MTKGENWGEFTRWKEQEIFKTKDCDEFEDFDLFSGEEDIFDTLKKMMTSFSEYVYNEACKKGYSGDREGLKKFLKMRLECIGIDKNERSKQLKTFGSWLNDTHRPSFEDEGRDKIYMLCFAVGLSAEETETFFQKAYMGRPFQCRRPEEAVYFVCLRKGWSFQEAQKILAEFKEADTEEPSMEEAEKGTMPIMDELKDIEDRDMLIQYLCDHPENFKTRNVTGLEKVKGLLEDCKKGINELRKSGKWLPGESDAWDDYKGLKDKKPIESNETLLKEIYGIYDRQSGAMNFRVLGDKFLVMHTNIRGLGNKVEEAKIPYDTIRKLLILLGFYDFFLRLIMAKDTRNEESAEFSGEDCYKEFKQNVDDTLSKCGYAKLYPGNPYDALFLLCASKIKKCESDDPLLLFQPLRELQAFANRCWQPDAQQNKKAGT